METAKRFSLAGKVALVTGSTRGIGRAIAEGFAAAGARVWLHGRDAQAGVDLARQLGGRFCQADLSTSEGARTLVETLAEAEERLDVLVNNAGMEIRVPITRMDMATFDLIWNVNTRSAVELTSLLLPLLQKAEAASIINVTSIHEYTPFPGNVAYTMSKAALGIFTRTIAVELGGLGIRVNNLAPGAIETDLNREAVWRAGPELSRRIPLKHVGQPDEMIGPALFLASDASRYVSGTTLYADGAYTQNLLRYE